MAGTTSDAVKSVPILLIHFILYLLYSKNEASRLHGT